MRVDASPRRLTAVPGQPAVITVRVTNTRDIISGHQLRVLGADPEWVSVDTETLSLFPEASGVAVVRVTLPAGIPAGSRHLTIQVTELTEPGDTEAIEVELSVPAEPDLTLAVDPVSVAGGRSASAGVVLENTGNAVLQADLAGVDEAGEVEFEFTPADPVLQPGEQLLGAVVLRAPRPWFGTPKVRPFTVTAGPQDAPVVAQGAWLQKPRLSRGALALAGLVAALTVFALVITASLSQVVSQSAADRDLALQVAQASQAGGAGGNGSISGTVSLLASGQPVAGVTVELFTAPNPTQPVVSTATGSSGGYHFSGLTSGSYKLLFSGAGFAELWYPTALEPDNAAPVTVGPGQAVTGVNIRLGGLPGSIGGQVVGANPSGAVLTLELPPGGPPGTTGGGSNPTGVPAVVTTRTLDASGNFSIGNVPSPSVYQIVVTKAGYAPAVQEVDLGGGEQRNNLVITLHQGDGSISGSVSAAGGTPIGGASISASSGTTAVSTVSLTTPGSVGQFTLSGLTTPATFTLQVGASGYATQTLSLSLAAGQHLSGVAVTLDTGVGSISGTVTTADGAAAGGVTVTGTNGQVTVSTVTLSVGAVGTYTLGGLPVPSTYTVTFSRPDLASQTQQIPLTSPASPNLTGVNASLVSEAASIYGTVTQTGGSPVPEVSVVLSSGSTSYQVTSADVPTAGAYEIDGITPGTYTLSFTRQGGLPTSSIVTLAAGQRQQDNPVLSPAASIVGLVVNSQNPSLVVPGAQVTLYLASAYPTVSIESTITGSDGTFTFPEVDAPQNYIVAVGYPQGGATQVTVLVTTTLGQAAPVCGSNATSMPTTTTLPGTPPCDPTTDPVEVSTA